MDTNTTNESTRRRIFELLDKKGAYAADLAASIGVSPFVVSHWKRNISTSYIKYLPQIAGYFGVTVDYLTGKSQDDELNDYLIALKNRPEMRQLFKVSKSATKEDVEQAVKIIEALKKPNDFNE